MNDAAARFIGSIPENYDKGLGPHIFVDYADDLARRAAATGARNALELAAGTGIVSVKLREALDPAARLTVTDLNEPMLEIAEAKMGAASGVAFQAADAMDLPFEDAAFDLIVNQFGVMFFPDKPASFREARRVLKPGGTYLFSAWSDHDANPFARVAYGVGAAIFPDDPPAFYKVPFSYPDPAVGEADLRAGGFKAVACETVAFEKQVRDWSLFAQGIVYGNPLFEEVSNRGADPEAVKTAMIEALEREFGPAPAKMPLSAVVYAAS